ncbi:MAG: MFS transporter [Pseudomonadota bacterium]|nr:MFS transporter [Pseudomonadota bacterium]
MLRRVTSVIALLASFSILCLGHGLQSVLLPARADLMHFSGVLIGGLMSSYYVGFIAGTFVCPWLIARVGHIRVFAAAAAGASAIMLAHSLTLHPLAWLLLRAIYGLCLVHLYTVMESWLNRIVDQDTRGRILSVYMIINFISMSLGQMLFFLAPADGFELFAISSMLLSLALVPLILSRIEQPTPIEAPQTLGVRRLLAISPLSVAGALAAGLMGSAYWGLTAAYVINLGFPPHDAAWFMAAGLMGGLLTQWPLGALSDRIGRRQVIMLASALVLSASLALALTALWSSPSATFGMGWLLVWSMLFGAGLHPLYSLCIAHANDFVGPEYFVRASVGLQLIQSVGAIIGPLAAGAMIHAAGQSMLFFYLALLAGALILYDLARIAKGRMPAFTKPFRLLTRTGLLAVMMDPRYRRRKEQPPG